MHVSRVLLAHNYYLPSARSGEDTVFADEAVLLERANVDVVRFEKKNEDLLIGGNLRKARVAVTAGWSSSVYKELTKVLKSARPQVAHFHNVFPQITPAAFAACQDAGIPVIHTLHNYRWRCASGLLLREGKPCELCWQGNPTSAIRYGCYQNSALATTAAVAAQLVNRRMTSSRRPVDRYIALTEFSKRKHIAAGLPAQLIEVKGNCVAEPPVPGTGEGGYVLFAGRFGVEKGVLTLLKAWEILGADAPLLRMFGGGPLDDFMSQQVKAKSLRIELVGVVPRSQVVAAMRDAAIVFVPSECYEGFPLVIAESLACGTPVVASRTGGLSEMIEEGSTGKLFKPGDAAALAMIARNMWADQNELRNMRSPVRDSYDRRFSAQRTVARLMEIYGMAIFSRQRHRE